MAFSPDVTGLVLRTFVSVVSRWLRRRARAGGNRGLLKTGGVTVIQRFGSALNLNVHFHTLMIDGVYELRLGGSPIFYPVPAPMDDDVAVITGAVMRKVGKKLARFDDAADETAVANEPLLPASPARRWWASWPRAPGGALVSGASSVRVRRGRRPSWAAPRRREIGWARS